jgi:regulator of RNase E activity RraA
MALSETLLHEARTSLYTAVLSDTLDSLGLTRQVLSPAIRPLDDRLVVCGRARTGNFLDIYHEEGGENPYALEIALIDDLKPGEVAVLACGATGRIAPWGELLSTAASMRGAAGCVTDGLTRDVRQIRAMKFPVFAGGIGPLDTRGRARLVAIDVPVECGGVRAVPGDLVFGDVDGVLVVPGAVEEEVVRKALEKVRGEDVSRKELREGALLGEVYARHGIL